MDKERQGAQQLDDVDAIACPIRRDHEEKENGAVLGMPDTRSWVILGTVCLRGWACPSADLTAKRTHYGAK